MNTTSAPSAADSGRRPTAASTWQPVTDGQLHSSSVGAVAVSESNPDVVYIGMGETELRGNIMQGDGVYKSTDAGKTWKHMGLADTQAIARIRIHPTNPDIVYVAAFGHPVRHRTPSAASSAVEGRRQDLAEDALPRRPDRRAVDLVHRSDTIRTCCSPRIWEAYRTPWRLSSGGPGSGLFKSTDGGDHWTEITRNPGMPAGRDRQDRRHRVRRRRQSRLRASSKTRTAACSAPTTRGATWKRVSEDRKPAPARVLLHAHLRRPEDQGHASTS